jgi:hypothetical protein
MLFFFGKGEASLAACVVGEMGAAGGPGAGVRTAASVKALVTPFEILTIT